MYLVLNKGEYWDYSKTKCAVDKTKQNIPFTLGSCFTIWSAMHLFGRVQ